MDKLQWFKFSYADWRMGKIQRCSEITQARFINLCCLYWSKDCFLTHEDAEIEIDKEHLDVLINKKIIVNSEGVISISFLDEQFAEIEEANKNKSKSGVIGNLKRWHPEVYKRYEGKEISLDEALKLSQNIAEVSQPDSTPIATQSQNIAEKSREEEIREEEKKEDKNNTPTAFSFRKSFLELGVDNDILNDWLAVRKKKKAVNSQTAFNLFVNEVGKSKITISQAVEKCAGSSWASYKVEYDKDNAVVQGSSVSNPRGKVKNRFNE